MKKMTMSFVVATLLTTSTALAETSGLPGWLDISGNVNFDVTGKDSADFESDLRVQDAEVRFEILAREGVKAVIKLELERQLQQAIDDEDIEKELAQLVEEAYIQIETDKVSGLPRAIVTAGKHRMAFGTRLSQLPMYKDSMLYKLLNEEELIGVTLDLPHNFFGMVDSVAVSLYETGAGDFKISKDKGASVRASKRLSSQIEATLSGLIKENGDADKETRGAVGLVFTSNDGKFQVWSEGIVMKNNPLYADSKYAGTLGAAMQAGRGIVVVEASAMEKNGQELAVAYNMPVGSYLILSPEVRLTKTDSGDKDTTVGIRARLEFGKKAARKTGRRA